MTVPLHGEFSPAPPVKNLHPRPAPNSLALPSRLNSSLYTFASVLEPMPFDQPVEVVFEPGNSSRIFVVEKTGKIILIPDRTRPTRRIFLDLSDRVYHESECGLLGLAFHPGYQTNGFFFTTYTQWSTDLPGPGIRWRLARWQVTPDNPLRAHPASELLLIDQPDEHPWHEGGHLAFGPDGYLYVSAGDEGESFNAFNNAQRIDRDFFGGILRLDVDQRPGSLAPNPHPAVRGHYAIPSDNPFIGVTHFNGEAVIPSRVRTEFFAIGMRNPWQFAFDPQTGLLVANDVGQNHREEINLVVPGGNYGWPAFEGTLAHPSLLPLQADPQTFLPPMAEYGYDSGGANAGLSIAAGLFYRGTRWPQWDGAYLFSDFWSGRIGLVPLGRTVAWSSLLDAEAQLRRVTALLDAPSPDIALALNAWEATLRPEEPRVWDAVTMTEVQSTEGTVLEILPDGSVRAVGPGPSADTYVVTFRCPTPRLAAIQLEVLTDESLPANGPGRTAGGTFVLSEFELSTFGPRPGYLNDRIPLEHATASFAQDGNPAAHALDLDMATGWAIAPRVGEPHHATFELVDPLTLSSNALLRCTLRQWYGHGATLGRFRLTATPTVAPVPDPIRTAAAKPPESRSHEEKVALETFFRSSSPELRFVRAHIAEIEELLHGTNGSTPTPTAPPTLPAGSASAPGDPLVLALAEWTGLAASTNPLVRLAQRTWETQWQESLLHWEPLSPVGVMTTGGSTPEFLPDASVRLTGPTPPLETYVFTAFTTSTQFSTIRLEALVDSSATNSVGPGRSVGGNFVLSEFSVDTAPADAPTAFVSIPLARAISTHDQNGFAITQAIDGNPATGWAIAPNVGQDHQAVFTSATPMGHPRGTWIQVTLRQLFGEQSLLGRFRIAIQPAPQPFTVVPPPNVLTLLAQPTPQHTEADRLTLARYFDTIYPPYARARADATALRDRIAAWRLTPQNLPIEWFASQTGLASFTLDSVTGDIWAADYLAGRIRQLQTMDQPLAPPPNLLSATGLFRDLPQLVPTEGLIPYSVNVPFWSDRAIKQRWFALPAGTNTMHFSADEHWQFPLGMVWVKHFDWPEDSIPPGRTQRLETRLLVREPNGVYGLSYRWNAAGTEAELVDPAGLTETFRARDNAATGEQNWRFPSHAECRQCHTAAAGYALGFSTAQLHRDHSIGTNSVSQLHALAEAGYLSGPLTNRHQWPALARADDASTSLEFRVRSYLQANCAYCHQPGGGARGLWDGRIGIEGSRNGIINGSLLAHASNPHDRVVVPGASEQSDLWRRISRLGREHMPPVATFMLDTNAIQLVRAWIEQDLPRFQMFADWQTRYFGTVEGTLPDFSSDPDLDGLANYDEFLLGRDPLDPASTWRPRFHIEGSQIIIEYDRTPNLSFQVQWTTDMAPPAVWHFLDQPENRPVFASEPGTVRVTDALDQSRTKFYRVITRPP